MPSASRGVVACLKMKYEIACANSTSTSASVRTLATLASAKARNQNSRRGRAHEAREQRRPPRLHDGAEHGAVAQREIERQQPGLQDQADRSVKVAASTKLGRPSDRIAPR